MYTREHAQMSTNTHLLNFIVQLELNILKRDKNIESRKTIIVSLTYSCLSSTWQNSVLCYIGVFKVHTTNETNRNNVRELVA